MGRSSKRLRRDRERRSGSVPLDALPASDERWEGGFLRWGPDVVFGIWVESAGGPIVAGDALEPGSDPAAATARLLLQAMRQPAAGPPRVPAVVAVRETRLAQELRALLARLDVAVLLEDDLPSWDEAATGLRQHLESESAPGYLARGVPAPVMGTFYEAAAEYYRAAPWRLVSDDVAIELRLPGRDPVYALVLGGEGVTYGLAVYRSLADVERTWSATEFPPPPVDAVAVTYDTEGNAPPAVAAERRAQRWPLAGPAAFPVPFCTTPENQGRIPDAEDLVLATVCLRAVESLGRREEDALRAGRELRQAVEVAAPDAFGEPATLTVDVAYPVRQPEVAEEDGFDPDSINTLSPVEVREVYEDFRRVTGAPLPAVQELEGMIRVADKPPLDELAPAFETLRGEELPILVSLLMRIWNTTPRPDLGGKMPDEVFRPGGWGR